ncbi:MAG: hypothetical protein JSR66_18065 [Proteobacteria bacterium]|nr:hypothetical protein [Pseudomonadota bacterium]
MLLALLGSLAIVVTDRASVRSMPRSTATELTTVWQGDVVEIRGEQAEYLRVYSYRRERGGYLRTQAVRQVAFTESEAPQLLAVLRFLRDMPGSEALGISYAAAYLKAVPPRSLTAEPFDAIGQMAERLADTASGTGSQVASVAARLEVVGQLGVRMRSFERNGRMQVCYDGELYRNVLTQPNATAEQRAHAVLGLTRPECIEPDLGPTARAALDDERSEVLDRVADTELTPITKSRLHARRAAVWAAVAYERARRAQAGAVAHPSGAVAQPPGALAQPPGAAAAAQRALAELTAVRPADMGEVRLAEYVDAVLRVSAVRWAAVAPAVAQLGGAFALTTTPADPGQTCVTLEDTRRKATLARRCTYGIVWPASAQLIEAAPAVVMSVQPLESWRELWVFHQIGGKWLVDVLSPGLDEPDAGYVDFAGFAPATSRILLVREVKERTRCRRWFEEVRLEDLVLVRQASTPELLRDFGRWQDVRWRRETLALRLQH